MTTRQAGSCPLQIEIMDSDMVEFGVDLVHELDRNYGFPPKRTMSQVQQDSRLRSCQLISVAVPLPLGNADMGRSPYSSRQQVSRLSTVDSLFSRRLPG